MAHKKHALNSVDIVINMFSSKEYDLLLTFNDHHFIENAAVIDQLHTGDIIEFIGYLTRLASKKNDLHSDEYSLAHLETFKVTRSTKENMGGHTDDKHSNMHTDGRYK